MKYAVVTSKTNGNTGLLAETVKNTLPQEDIVYYGTPDDRALDADMIFLGFWTDEGVCDGDIRDFMKRLEGKEVFLFGSAGWGDPDYFRQVLKASSDELPKSNTVAGTFMCQGRMGKAVRERYERLPDRKQAEPLLENFDRALSHPDEKDLARLSNTVRAFV